jgi:hypothetical protein
VGRKFDTEDLKRDGGFHVIIAGSSGVYVVYRPGTTPSPWVFMKPLPPNRSGPTKEIT